jgi:hypothetical protein
MRGFVMRGFVMRGFVMRGSGSFDDHGDRVLGGLTACTSILEPQSAKVQRARGTHLKDLMAAAAVEDGADRRGLTLVPTGITALVHGVPRVQLISRRPGAIATTMLRWDGRRVAT